MGNKLYNLLIEESIIKEGTSIEAIQKLDLRSSLIKTLEGSKGKVTKKV